MPIYISFPKSIIERIECGDCLSFMSGAKINILVVTKVYRERWWKNILKKFDIYSKENVVRLEKNI